jgi:50S ribosomal subunit-associated GTPase HflX
MSSGFPCHILFSDTVGFIKKLPHQLVESFKSTLEEVSTADLLLHVVDCSDPKLEKRIAQTREVLQEIGAGNITYFMVYNKLDAYPEFYSPISDAYPSFAISALNKTGLPALQAELVAVAEKHFIPV